MEGKKVSDLSDEELMRELVYVNKMNKFWYARKEEVMKEIERRADND